MEIKQRSGWVQTHFEFDDEVLHYSHRTMTMTRARAISYTAFELEERSTLVKQNFWLVIVGALLSLIGAVMSVAEGVPSGQYLVWLGCFVTLGGLRKTRYILIEVERGEPIFVLADSGFDAVLNELTRRRRDLWHRLYADYDPTADPRDELKKFEWLLERKVISPEDFEWVRSEIEMSQRGFEPDDLN